MIRSDLHTHTFFCDGHNSPEEMVLAAIARGMDCIGFSGHALTSFDPEWCMSFEGMQEYIREIHRLKEQYADKIRILCGAEWDYFSDGSEEGIEYKIGSVHYIGKDGMRKNVDESPESFKKLVSDWYDGDYYAAAECYYSLVGNVLEQTGADIVGHFDLITKFNEGSCLFDETYPRYRAAWQDAADRLLTYGKPFEINTGAMSRGYRTAPYPSVEIMDYIAAHGGSFILSSDSHSTGSLLYGFNEWEQYCREHGYKLVTTVCT